MKKVFLNFSIIILLLVIPQVTSISQLDVHKVLYEIPKQEKEIVLTYNKKLLNKEKRKYFIICDSYKCTKTDTIFAKEQAMILQDSLGVPFYSVTDITKANCKITIRKLNQ